jgi:hypothetical protein
MFDIGELKNVRNLLVGYRPPPTDAVISITLGMASENVSLRSKMITIGDRCEIGSLRFSLDCDDANRIVMINNGFCVEINLCKCISGHYKSIDDVLALRLRFKESSIEIFPSVFPEFLAIKVNSGDIITMIGSPEYDIDNYMFE